MYIYVHIQCRKYIQQASKEKYGGGGHVVIPLGGEPQKGFSILVYDKQSFKTIWCQSEIFQLFLQFFIN